MSESAKHLARRLVRVSGRRGLPPSVLRRQTPAVLRALAEMGVKAAERALEELQQQAAEGAQVVAEEVIETLEAIDEDNDDVLAELAVTLGKLQAQLDRIEDRIERIEGSFEDAAEHSKSVARRIDQQLEALFAEE